MTKNKRSILYHFDPLCGWCYGFLPTAKKIRSTLSDSYHWIMAPGGLVVGERVAPIGQFRDYLLHGFKAVEARTGVKPGEKFIDGLLKKGDYIADSEPPSRAIVIAQDDYPDRSFAFAHALCQAHYQEGLPLDAEETLRFAADQANIPSDELLSSWHSEAAKQRVQECFLYYRRLGLRSFPSLAFLEHNSIKTICSGFSDSESILSQIDVLINH